MQNKKRSYATYTPKQYRAYVRALKAKGWHVQPRTANLHTTLTRGIWGIFFVPLRVGAFSYVIEHNFIARA